MASGKRDRQRGGRIAAWFWGFFLAAQLIGGLLLDYVWPQIRFPRAYQQFHALQQFPRSPDIICLGSSRTESTIHDSSLSRAMRHFTGDPSVRAFNAQVPGGDLISAEFVWKGLWRRGARPSLLVIEVLPEEVNHLNDWLKLHVLRQLTWPDVPAYAVEVTRTQHLLRLVQSRLVPLYTHRCELWRAAQRNCGAPWLPASSPAPEAVLPGYHDIRAEALIEQPLQPEQIEQSTAGLHEIERGLRLYRPGGSSCKALERILTHCRRHSIDVLLLGIPVSSRHRALYTPQIEADFQSYLRQVEQTWGCRYVDCRDQSPDWLFRDNHHSLPLGGEYFSQRFAREVLGPEWLRLKRHQPGLAVR
jgi:hypothetical protein